MSLVETQTSKPVNLRRSQRVCLSMPVVIYKDGPGPHRSFEETRTLMVNAHGALIVLHMAVQLGQLLTLKNAKTHQELSCRVVNLGPHQGGKTEVGIEFEQPAPRFWRIAFPPADWSPHSPEAKAPTRPQTLRR
jgi:hypothetical protein